MIRTIKYVCAVVAVMLASSVSGVFAGNVTCGTGLTSCGGTPVQSKSLFNTQTTGAATTAVTVTLAAITAGRSYIFAVEGRCNTAAATSGLTITDGGTTIWSTVGTEVIAATNFVRNWSPALTSATNSAVVITLAACTAGTGTLIVQANQW